MLPPNDVFSSAALVVAHPGHELRLFRWMEVTRPVVSILTDGSGSGVARINSSRDLLTSTGSRAGSVMGPYTDLALYDDMLRGDVGLAVATTARLADDLIERDVRIVVCDAFEFYNPAHDLCAVMTALAVARAEAAGAAPIERYEYAVTEATLHTGDVITLSRADLERKIAAAARFEGLAFDVETLVARLGIADLEHEAIRPLRGSRLLPEPQGKPFYETHGERRVESGRYDVVLRYEEHFVPFVQKMIAHLDALACTIPVVIGPPHASGTAAAT